MECDYYMSVEEGKKFEFLEHTADAKFRAYGDTLEEAFENVSEAMMNVMIDTSGMEGMVTKHIELEAPDLENLVVDWLSEILFLFEVEEIVFCRFEVDRIEKRNNSYHITGKAIGDPIDPSKHRFDTHAKAVTYNDLKVEESEAGWMLQVTVDT